MKFSKLTEAEQAEFVELTKDCIDPVGPPDSFGVGVGSPLRCSSCHFFPDFYSEDDLPMFRASTDEGIGISERLA